MKLLKKSSVLITFAAVSLSGPSAWAQDSFVATTELSGFNVVPSVESEVESDLLLPFSEATAPSTTGETTLAQAQLNPWRFRLTIPLNVVGSFKLRNIRLYFGQRFANGQPIATLCDDKIRKIGRCPENPDLEEQILIGNLSLSSIQFPPEQRGITNDLDQQGRLLDSTAEPCFDDLDHCGLQVMKRLIKNGLIYVVVNSDFNAKLREDGTITHEPRKGRLTVDGDLRGTLRLCGGQIKCPSF